MILYTEHSRAELLNRVWVWLECSHLLLYMVIPGVCVRVCVCIRVCSGFPVSFSIQLLNAWCVHGWVCSCSSTLQHLGHQPLLPRMLWQTHLNDFQENQENPRQTYQTEKPLTGQDTTQAPSKQREMHDIA